MKLKSLTTALALTLAVSAGAQTVQKVQPEFWYAGMQDKNLQVLIYGQGISKCKATISSPSVKEYSEQRVSNKNYLFLNLTLADNAQPGTFDIMLKDSTSRKKAQKLTYELKARNSQKRGFSDRDLIYMLMPDRFANGNTANDNLPGCLEIADNTTPCGRHGGDLKGLSDHVDYFRDLGVTAVWINPLLENNMPIYSYHGYSITDFYNVDARFGNNSEYQDLARKLHENGIKLIMDMVFNHCGSQNIIIKDMPDSSWVHQWPEFTRSNYRGTVSFDPHASESDKKYLSQGWFDTSMPDLNHENPMLETYLIQNSIWWAEYLGLDGIRMDTYPYNNKETMQRWCQAMHREFPGISLLGEVWLNENPFVSYYANGMKNLDGYTSGLDHTTDFPLTFAIQKAFNEGEGWDTGMTRLYQHFVSDYMLPHPEQNVVFADNHDLARIATSMGGDMAKLKMIYTLLLTTRGIPCMYYGSEIKMESQDGDDGYKRKNMPGGWPGDTKNVFTNQNLSPDEADMKAFITNLANFRKKSPAFSGKMIHFVPQDGVYVYFRIADNQRVMVIINNNADARSIDTARYAECLNGAQNGKDIISGNTVSLSKIDTKGKTAMVIEY